MKQLMSGNEAIARGAYEAGGVDFASAYPGTPSTEIVEYLQQYDEVHAEWAINEKVAMETAIGASIAGGRSMAAMKMVGVNVAADPLFTLCLIWGGLMVDLYLYLQMIQECFHHKMNKIIGIMQNLLK